MNKIVVISALWCPSCLILKKYLKKLNDEYPNIEIEALDYDFDEEKVKEYDVKDILPVIIANNKKLVGEKSYEEIVEFLSEVGII